MQFYWYYEFKDNLSDRQMQALQGAKFQRKLWRSEVTGCYNYHYGTKQSQKPLEIDDPRAIKDENIQQLKRWLDMDGSRRTRGKWTGNGKFPPDNWTPVTPNSL